MNLYIRYFDTETLVTNVDDALTFLDSLDEIELNDKIVNDVKGYFESDNRFPKRYKVRPKIYFIMIKTTANTMEEFKDYRNNAVNNVQEPEVEEQKPETYTEPAHVAPQPYLSYRDRMNSNVINALQNQHFGWYEGTFDFKRVVTIPTTGKNEYRDTRFVVQCKAMSGQDCYNRIVDYLRGCVDSRSQFPSAKGKNFSFVYLGACKEVQE